jgi:hypothetical protein
LAFDLSNCMILVVVKYGTTLKLKISYVTRKGGTWDLECAPTLVVFMEDLISTLCFFFDLVALGMLLVVEMIFF